MKTTITLALALLLDAAPAQAADDPLEGITAELIDIELNQAPVDAVYKLMSDITGVTFDVEACGGQTLSVKLEKAPVPVALRVMAGRLGRSYERDGDRIRVRCEGEADPEIDAQLRDFPAGAAIDLVAAQAGVSVAHRNCEGASIDLEARRVPVSAVLSAMATQLSATLTLRDGTWQFTCARSATSR